jgi:hypothetical protein
MPAADVPIDDHFRHSYSKDRSQLARRHARKGGPVGGNAPRI